MPDFYDDTQIDLVYLSLSASDQGEIYAFLAEKLSETLKMPAHKICNLLLSRESQTSSGIGEGLAIPELKIQGLQTAYSVLATLENPVDFQALDSRPVDVICVLFSPERESPAHLRPLSRLTRTLKNPDFLEQIRAARNIDQIRTLFSDPDGWLIAA